MKSTIFGSVLVMGSVACGSVEEGAVDVCSTFELSGEEELAQVSGTVTGINEGVLDCDQSVSIEDAAGQQWRVGVSILDATGADIAPAIDLDIGDSISIEYRFHMVFGSVEGLVITDDFGVVVAADEGAWGGALTASALPFSVSRGQQVVSSNVTPCMTMEGYEIIFEGDDTVVQSPVSISKFLIEGQEMQTLAIRSTLRGPGRNCSASDISGQDVAWAVFR